MMRRNYATCVFLLLFMMQMVHASVSRSHMAEDWKGTPDTNQSKVSVLTGMGIIGSSVGFALLGSASSKILPQGFISGVNNSASIEGTAGPVFMSGTNALAYSAHLRWDFQKDQNWTFYALGGVGGNARSFNGGTHVEFGPRFGIGTFWKTMPNVQWRAEISHDLLAVGVGFPLD